MAESHEAGHHLNQTEEGDFDSLLQEQLARLRRSWNHEMIQQPTAAPATHLLQHHVSDLCSNSSEASLLWPRYCGSSVGAPGAGVYQRVYQEPGGSGSEHDSMTFRQHALRVARQDLQTTRDPVEWYQVIFVLAEALGAARVEKGTLNALQAVLLQLDRPGMSDTEAYTSTGASKSNFMKWRMRVKRAKDYGPPKPFPW